MAAHHSIMKRFFSHFLFPLAFFSCGNQKPVDEQAEKVQKELTSITSDDYELYKPADTVKAVLMLFGGYQEDPEDIKRERNILELAEAKNVAALFCKYHRKL